MDPDNRLSQPKTSSKLLSIGEASEYLGISIDTLRRWEKRKKITALRSPGGHRYFDKDDLDNLFGRKYERAPETKPRKIAEVLEDNEKEPEVHEEEKTEDNKVEMGTEAPKLSQIPEILTREPREINIPRNEPIRIIQTESFTQIKEITQVTQPSQIPPQEPPVIIENYPSILTPPSPVSQPPVTPTPSKVHQPEKAPINYKPIIIIGAALLFIIFLIITYFLWQSSQQVLSPIP